MVRSVWPYRHLLLAWNSTDGGWPSGDVHFLVGSKSRPKAGPLKQKHGINTRGQSCRSAELPAHRLGLGVEAVCSPELVGNGGRKRSAGGGAESRGKRRNFYVRMAKWPKHPCAYRPPVLERMAFGQGASGRRVSVEDASPANAGSRMLHPHRGGGGRHSDDVAARLFAPETDCNDRGVVEAPEVCASGGFVAAKNVGGPRLRFFCVLLALGHWRGRDLAYRATERVRVAVSAVFVGGIDELLALRSSVCGFGLLCCHGASDEGGSVCDLLARCEVRHG